MGRDLTGLKKANEDKAELKAYYSEVAKSLDNVIRYKQDCVLRVHQGLSEYIEESRSQNKPLTMGGLVKASTLPQDVFYKARQGDYDWLCMSYMDRHDIPLDNYGTVVDVDGEMILLLRLSEVIKSAELEVQIDRESLCMDRNARNAGGAIFLLKAQQGLQDTPQDIVNHQTLNINVASLEEAQQALKRLE